MAPHAAEEKATRFAGAVRHAAGGAADQALNASPVGRLAESVGFLSDKVDMGPQSVELDELVRQLSSLPDKTTIDPKGQDLANRAVGLRLPAATISW
jgi:hypothetical protein